ncbi:hypothetical protein HAX54_022502, partial [Datura stramonium]|nr:hypothetical protein [Datura stramonium]
IVPVELTHKNLSPYRALMDITMMYEPRSIITSKDTSTKVGEGTSCALPSQEVGAETQRKLPSLVHFVSVVTREVRKDTITPSPHISRTPKRVSRRDPVPRFAASSPVDPNMRSEV